MASKRTSVLCFVIFLAYLLASEEALVNKASAAGAGGGGGGGGRGGACGRTPINEAAASLSPCLGAAGNPKIKVPAPCCAKVGALIKSDPRCLCAVVLSPLAKKAGIKPAIAIGIPKRCNIRNRPAGKKCGPYIVP